MENSFDFSSLHCDVLRNILSDWIDVVDIALLDTAYCSYAKRPLLLAVLSTLQIDRLCTRVWIKYENFLAWILNRCICLTDLTLFCNLDETLCESLIKRMGMRVRSVSLLREDSVHGRVNMLHLISLYCQNILKLSCKSFRDLQSICDVLRQCPALSELQLRGTLENLNLEAIKPETVCCKNLALLNLEHIDVDDPVAVYILQCAPHLRSLKIKVAEAPIFQISSLKKLQRLGLRHSSIGDEALVEITKSCMQIEHLDLSDCGNLTDAGIAKAVCCLQTMRSLGVEFIDLEYATLQKIVQCHSTSLEAFYAHSSMEEDHVDFLLGKCHVLHTLRLDIELLDFEQINCSLFKSIKKLVLSGDEEECAEEGIFDALVLLAPHCQKLEFLGLVPRSEYNPNWCAGLESVIWHCASLHTIEFVGMEGNDDIDSLYAATELEWYRLRPNLKVQYYMDYDEEDHPLLCDIFDV